MAFSLRRTSTDEASPFFHLFKGKVTYVLCGITCVFLALQSIPSKASFGRSSSGFIVEPGYSQGGVVSGAIFQGKPYRKFTGKRIFTDGWEKRVGTRPLDYEKIVTKLSKRRHSITTATEKASTKTCSKWSVVTTIFDPSEAIQDAANMGDDWCIVIVGDRKTPADFLDSKLKNNDSVFYFDVAEQEAWGRLPGELGVFVRSLPFNHFARKNFGFLYAILRGAKFIYDFDDDNYVKKDAEGKLLNLIPNEKELGNVRHLSVETFAFNHHSLMGATIETSWARGFPLERIQDAQTGGKVIAIKDVPMNNIGVIQFCADTNPDIDAVHRLTKPLPMSFTDESMSSPLLVPSTTAAPYNAQATIHHFPAFFATLLPITVKSRVSDIWRAYYAAPLFRGIGISLVFAPPKINQIRTAHNYIGDMKAEGDLYFKSDKLTEFLHGWSSSKKTLPARMEQLWIDLYERGYHEEGDITLVQNWLAALVQIQYDFRTPL